VSTIDGIAAYRISDKTSTSIHVTNLPPQAIYNPAHNTIAYVDSDPVNPSIPQIYFITASGDDSRRVTFHEEGTISDMVWTEGKIGAIHLHRIALLRWRTYRRTN
jgi:hypothetical protein